MIIDVYSVVHFTSVYPPLGYLYLGVPLGVALSQQQHLEYVIGVPTHVVKLSTINDFKEAVRALWFDGPFSHIPALDISRALGDASAVALKEHMRCLRS